MIKMLPNKKGALKSQKWGWQLIYWIEDNEILQHSVPHWSLLSENNKNDKKGVIQDIKIILSILPYLTLFTENIISGL